MSNDWVKNIRVLHEKMGVRNWVEKKIEENDYESFKKLLDFRIKFLDEELTELKNAQASNDSEEIVDALIDLCVVAIGTLDLFNVDAYKAWETIFYANMTKKPGIKPSRPNPLGLPDLIKPEGWIGPDHTGNHGILSKI